MSKAPNSGAARLSPSWSALAAALPALPPMAEAPLTDGHVKPYVHETLGAKALHFSMCDIQSRMQLDDPHALDLDYTRTMMGFLLFNAEPHHIAMIGLGGGSLAKFCHRYLPRSRIHVVEINPHVIALRDEFHVPPDSDRFSVELGDGAQYVRDSATPCDVLLVDGFDSDGQPSRLSSQRFYDDCHELLQPEGLMVVNLHQGHPRKDAFLARIRRSFGDAVLVVDGVDLGNTVVLACKGRAFDTLRLGTVRRPPSLDAKAAAQLRAGFAAVATALRGERGRRTPWK